MFDPSQYVPFVNGSEAWAVLATLIIAVICLYFLLSFIASEGNFPKKDWLFWVNFFAGWTFIG
jgi:hypothetical protein